MNPEFSSVDDLMTLDELQGKETARHKGGREGKEELTGDHQMS
jgi:hypothetical protein